MTHPLDALLEDLRGIDPGGLDDASLKDLLRGLGRVRSGLDALEAAAIVELDQRGCYASDGALNVKSWLAHHTGVARPVAGSRVRLAKRLARLPVMAASLAAGEVTDGHARSLGRCITSRTLEALVRDEAMLVNDARRSPKTTNRAPARPRVGDPAAGT